MRNTTQTTKHTDYDPECNTTLWCLVCCCITTTH